MSTIISNDCVKMSGNLLKAPLSLLSHPEYILGGGSNSTAEMQSTYIFPEVISLKVNVIVRLDLNLFTIMSQPSPPPHC